MCFLAARVSAVRTIFCAVLVSGVHAYRFAGGIFTWAPTESGNQIKIEFRLSWNRSSFPCDVSSDALIGEGTMRCFSGCSIDASLLGRCIDYSATDQWSSGRNSFTYTPTESKFSFGFSGSAWMNLVAGGGSWSLKTTADVSRRPDTNRINSSPTVEMSPVVALQHGCQNQIILPVHDADGDFIRCRFAATEEECGGVCRAISATLNSTGCALQYTANGDQGMYAVAIQIEDFLSASSTTPLSSVSLQFLIKVFSPNGLCSSQPEFVSPTPAADTCFPLSANTYFTFTVVAFTNNQAGVKRIDTVKNGPSTNSSQFSNSTGKYMRLDINWTPTLSNAGSHSMCFSAVDSNELRSEHRCVYLYVEAKPNLVDVKKTESGRFISWELIYDKRLKRPANSKFIYVYEESGALHNSLDATSDNVTFEASKIRFAFSVDLAKSYYILLQSGLVLGGCSQPSDAMDNKTQIVIKRKECPYPPTTVHGIWNVNSTGYGDLANITCDIGYQLLGDVTLICGADETWQGQHPSCTIVESGYGGSCYIGEQCTTFLSVCIRTGLGPGTCGCLDSISYNETADECTANGVIFCSAGMDRFGLLWNKTKVLTTAYKQCPIGSSGQIIRKCLIHGTFSSTLYNCTRDAFKNIAHQSTNFTTIEVIESLQEALSDVKNSSKEIYAGDIGSIETILTHIVDKEANETTSPEQVKLNAQRFFDVASTLTDPETSGPVWESRIEHTNEGVEKITDTIDRYSLNLASIVESSNETTLTIQKDNLVATVSKVNEDPDIDLTYPENQSLLFVSNRTSSFTLKRQIDKVTTVVVVVYRDISKALPKRNDQQRSQSIFGKISSQVLSIQLLPKPPEVLNPPIQLSFSIDEHREGFEAHCSFWTATTDGTSGGWSTSGCERTMANATTVQCSCSHLTNFAILTSPIETPSEHQTALTTLSLIGCVVSIVCLIVTLILQVTYRRFLKGDKNILAMTVCVSLLVAYLLFLFGITRTEVKVVCTTVAVLLHYIFLLVFFLLLAEGIYMALQVVLPFHKKSHLKELLIGAFAIPAVFVLIVASATELHGYGNDKYCWLIVDSLAFWMFVGPALIIIVFNLTIIILILKKMSSTKWIKDMSQREKAKTLASKTLVMLPVMGVTWLFGILSVHESAIWLQYVFVLFNSFQGLFIFLFHCVLNRQLRAAISKSRQHISTLSEETSRSHRNTDHAINLTTITHVEPTSTVANDFKTDQVMAASSAPKRIGDILPAIASEEEKRQFKKRHAISSQTHTCEDKPRRPPTQVLINLQHELRDRLRNVAHAVTARAIKMCNLAQQDTDVSTRNTNEQSLQKQPHDDQVQKISNLEEDVDADFVVGGGSEAETHVLVTIYRTDDLKDCKESKEDPKETNEGCSQNGKDPEEDKEEKEDLKQTEENQTGSRNEHKGLEDEQKDPGHNTSERNSSKSTVEETDLMVKVNEDVDAVKNDEEPGDAVAETVNEHDSKLKSNGNNL